MEDITRIDIKDTLQTVYCIDMEEGQMIYNLVRQELDDGKVVELSFAGVEMVITAFLNAAVGRLFAIYDHGMLQQRVRVNDLQDDFLPIWKHVMSKSARYYTYSAEVEHHTNNEMED